MPADFEQDLLGSFAIIHDPREENKRKHKLFDILIMSLCAVICGAEGFAQIEMFARSKKEWFEQFLELPHGIPSHDTFGRVFALIDPCQFEHAFLAWTQGIHERLHDIVALDGKTLRRSHDRRHGKNALQMVSAWSCQNNLVLGQISVEQESNEITAVPELLKKLYLEECLVTADAMHCQKKLVRQLREKKADYLLSLKENQEKLYNEVEALFDEEDQTSYEYIDNEFYEESDKGHGRFERRRYWMLTDVEKLKQRKQWKDLRSVIMVERLRETKEKKSIELSYYISSLEGDVERAAKGIRWHWHIENKLHWVLDVEMGEDQSRIRVEHAAENFAHLRRMALNLLKQDTSTKAGMKSKQKKAGWDSDYLFKILSSLDN